jgi:peptidoglycan/LPS O-acetylase OafA/YrhL
VERYNWTAYVLTTAVLIALLPLAGAVVDYGSEGWLWALFGLSQRMFVDNKAQGVDPGRISKAALIRVFICVVTAVIYIWQEQKEFSFSETQLTVAAICVVTLALGLCAFSRGKSRVQPPRPIAWFVGVIGRQTLAIYALELVFFELLIKFVPSLAH